MSGAAVGTQENDFSDAFKTEASAPVKTDDAKGTETKVADTQTAAITIYPGIAIKPTMTVHPQPQTVTAGGYIEVSAAASGTRRRFSAA